MSQNASASALSVLTFDQTSGTLTSLTAGARQLLGEFGVADGERLTLALVERHIAARAEALPADAPCVEATGETRELRRRYLLPDGRRIDMTRIWSAASNTVLIIDVVTPDDEANLLRRRVEALLASAGDAILSIDADQKIVLFNRQAENLFGYTASEIIGQPLDMLLPESFRERHRRYIAAFDSEVDESREMSGRPEIKGRRKDGSEFPAAAAISKVETDKGTIYTGVIRDLTELRAAEARVKAHEAQLRTIIEGLPFGVAVCRPGDGRVLFANSAFAGLVGEPLGRLLGDSLTRFYEDAMPAGAAVGTSRRTRPVEIPIRTAEGSQRWVVNSVVKLMFGGEEALLCACYDVTDRHRALEALRQNRRMLAKAQSIARVGSWNWNVQLDRLEWSDETCRIFELDGAAAPETYGEFRDYVHPDDISLTHQGLRRAILETAPTSTDLRIRLAGGRTKFVHLEVDVECDRDGRVERLVGTIQDMTEVKRVEQELRIAKEEADAANRAKSMFLANMSHELRTPLNAILGFSEIMASDILGPIDAERCKDYAHNIHCSGQHLLNVVNDILDLSRVEAGRVKLDEAAFAPAQVIDECLDMVAENAASASLVLERKIEPGLPFLNGDERLFKQIMLNLLSNAIKFTPEQGHVRVSAEHHMDGSLRFVVSDDGIGIAPEEIPKLLKPFAQAENHLSRRYQGTGLGLALSNEFMRLHNGKLVLDSTPGKGTSVGIRFPASRVVYGGPEAVAATR